MYKFSLNDLSYDFEPLPAEPFRPDPNYKVDEAELQRSIARAREIGDKARATLREIEQKELAKV